MSALPRTADIVIIGAGAIGHGFQHSPVAGEMVAEELTVGRPSLDLTDLRLGRF